MVNADDLYPPATFDTIRAWSGPGHAVAGFALQDTILRSGRPVNRALCRLDTGGQVVRLVEASIFERGGAFVAREVGSPSDVPVAAGQLVSMNAWAFMPSIWPHLSAAAASSSREVLLPVVMGELLAAGAAAITCLPVGGACLGLTWPEELEPVRALVASRGAGDPVRTEMGQRRFEGSAMNLGCVHSQDSSHFPLDGVGVPGEPVISPVWP